MAEQLEDRRLLSVALPAVDFGIGGPVAAPADSPAVDGPTVVDAAAATPNPVTGTTTNLSVLGDDDSGESDLTYTWTTLGTPPAPVIFSVNGTNNAKNTVATFAEAGDYTFQVTLTDSSNLTAVSNVDVTVNQTATSVVVTPANTSVAEGNTSQLSATELDQFGTAMTAQPTFTWSVTSGGGSVNASGLYTAATVGAVSVSAADGSGASGSAAITVVAPLVWYQADATSGTTLVDSSGNNESAALTGSTFFNTGYSGNAINFAGGYATLPTGVVSSLNDFTIAAWVDIPTLTPGARIFDFGSGTNDYMYLTDDFVFTGGLTFGISTGGKTTEQQVTGPVLSGGAWEHIAVTLAGDQATLYVNGNSVASGTITLTPSSLGSTTHNYLGKSQFSTDAAFIGAIDDFRIYGAALGAAQLQQIAQVSLPAGWNDSDIGSPSLPGSASFDSDSGVWTVSSSGTNIYNAADSVNFASQTLSGDLVLIAEVINVGDTSDYAQAGLMIRSSLDAGSVEASLVMTPDEGVEMISRTGDDQSTGSYAWTGITGPVWLQLDRIGGNVAGYLSNDDVNWYQVGFDIFLPVTDPVMAGLVVTTANPGSYNEATFENVSVAENAAPTIVNPATAEESTFVGDSTTLSVLGADDAGQQNLTYSWGIEGTAPAPVSFSANGTNGAKVTQATFTTSGMYNLVATVTDAAGYTVQSDVVVNVSVPPATPTGVSAQWNGSSVSVTWQPVAGAAGYNIYRATTVGGEGGIAWATNVTSDSFVDGNVTVGTTYYYQVTAVGAGGLESARSFEVASMTGPYTTPIISEFMASNNTTLADAAGDYPDWLELYNPTASAVSLTGDYLTDSAKTLNEWQIPSATLSPGAFLVVFADSENETDTAGAFHTNFSIGASGGYLALVGSNGTTVLSSYTYTQQVSDIAYGIAMAQTGSVISYGGAGFLTPTPGRLNGPVIATGITAQPTFNYPSGFYSTTMQLQIASATAGASIYYTLDGSAPSATNGTLYTGTLTVSGETDIRAMAVAPENLPSSAAAASYIYLSQVLTQSADGQAPAGWPVDWGYSVVHYGMDPSVVNNSLYSSEIAQDLLDLPSVSLSMNLQDLFDPVSGIYSESQLSQGIDREGSIELINPSDAAGFQADVGVSLKGDSSAADPDAKHGFDIHFSSEYGISELNYPLFGANAAQSFKEFQLRTDQENSWSFSDPADFSATRDELTSSLLAAVGQPAEHYKVCFLYVDGMFWGLYDMIEKPDDDFAASYFGESASDYDVIKPESNSSYVLSDESIDGTLNAWTELYTDVSTLDLSNNANYEMIQGNNPDGTKNAAYPDLLDVNNLINYMLVTDYVGNVDGPYNPYAGPNNFYAIRPIDGNFGFRFIATDSESTFQDVNQNVVDLSPDNIYPSTLSTPAYIFGQLQNNAAFDKLVGDLVEKDFFNGGALTTAGTTAMFTTLVSELQGPVVAESARWGDTLRPGEAYTRDNDWQPLINSMLSSYFPQRTQIVVNQLQDFGLFPTVAAPLFNQYGGTITSGFQLTMTQSGAGTIYYTLDGSDPQNAEGGVSTTAVAYTGPISLFTTTTVNARVLSNGIWSAAVSESFIAAASSVRITELNYDPAKPPTGSSYNNDDFEFVELENFSSTTVNLAGVAFTDGITYTFGNVYLLPGQSGVLVHNTAAFVSRYGSSFNIIGDYLSTGQSFSNSGEDVELVDASGNILDHFDYTPCISAYPTAHGKGAALVPVNPGGMTNLNLATNWTVTTYTNGTLPLLLGSTPVYLELDPDGQHIDIWNANTASGPANQSVPIAEINSISFIASGAADMLTVNFSNGDPISVVPLYFDGNSVGTLSVVGVSGAKTVTSNGSTATISAGFGSASIAYLNGGFNFAFTVADTVNVSGGVFSLAESTTGDTPLTIGTASVSAGGTLQLLSSIVAANQNELVLNNLSLAGSSGAWTGKLDLGSNNLILKNGSLATVLNQLAEGFYGGGGIMTSETITSAYTTTLGYEMGGSVIDGVSTTSADVVVKYTYFGDANLDGKVDGSDYSRIDSGFVTGATGWMNGDFNYDGVINGSDYTLIDNAFNNQGASLAAEIAPRAGTKSLSRKGSREADDAPLPNSSVFQTQTPISLALSTDGSIERSMQAKDLLDRLSAAD